MWTIAFPSLTGAVYILPSISTLTVPVESAGRDTSILAVSPALISSATALMVGLIGFTLNSSDALARS